MKIVSAPHKVLQSKAKNVTTFDTKLRTLIAEMTTTLNACNDPIGVGLAAPQVGVSSRIFIMKPKQDGPVSAFVNPEIIRVTAAKTKKHDPDKDDESLEGCLSIPRIWGIVGREGGIQLRWADVHGKIHEAEFTGFEAVIIQHEIDHLEGVLFTQRVLEQGETLYEEKGKKLYPLSLE